MFVQVACSETSLEDLSNALVSRYPSVSPGLPNDALMNPGITYLKYPNPKMLMAYHGYYSLGFPSVIGREGCNSWGDQVTEK